MEPQPTPEMARPGPRQYVFSASRLSVQRSGVERRHHLDESDLLKAIRQAAQRTLALCRYD